jgi:DnaA family protein
VQGALKRLETTGLRVAYTACRPETRLPDGDYRADAVALDDVERLGESGQMDLFNLYNGLRDTGKTLLATGNVAPMQLALRADVVTRLAWGLVYEVRSLTDLDKAEALAGYAAMRGFTLPADVSTYLLTHLSRDMPALLAVLDALDRYSLEEKRAVTVPLLRELLALGEGAKE